jgi:hypothetical protein
MKNKLKFGEISTTTRNVIIIVVIVMLIFGGVQLIKDILSDISKIFGPITNLFESAFNSLSSCVKCRDKDSTGNKVDPKEDCPGTGVPFFNWGCGGFLMTAFAILASVLYILAKLARIKTKSSLTEAIETHNNESSKSVWDRMKRIVDITRQWTDSDYKMAKDTLKLESFKDTWNKDHSGDPVPESITTKEQLDIWIDHTASSTDRSALQDLRKKTDGPIDKMSKQQWRIDSARRMVSVQASNQSPTTSAKSAILSAGQAEVVVNNVVTVDAFDSAVREVLEQHGIDYAPFEPEPL